MSATPLTDEIVIDAINRRLTPLWVSTHVNRCKTNPDYQLIQVLAIRWNIKQQRK